MAEFTLGLTKTAVEGTLSRVKSAIEEEAKLKVRVKNDLVFITGEFQIMRSFLNATNTAERAKNQVVHTWVRQLRDLAFDVEDCIELVVDLDTNKSGWWWRLVPSCMAGPLPLDVAVAEIQLLKARVEDVSQRNTRYNFIKDSGSDSKTTAVTIVSSPTAAAPDATSSASTSAVFHTLGKVWEAAGKKRGGMGDLKKLVNSEGSHLEVISLYMAIGGVGGAAVAAAAAHIIRETYNDPEIGQEFSIRAWVKLIHPFNLDEFLNNLLTQFYATSTHHHPGATSMVAPNVHIEARLMEQVREERYLVILEDVSNVVEWNVIKKYLLDNNKGSRIIVSTQHLGLALFCTGKPYQVSELGHFSHGQSLCAFNKKVTGRCSDMNEFSWLLRCGGVISMWGDSKSATFLDSVYTSITHSSMSKLGFDDGVKFEKHSWVDVPSPFNLDVFSRRLLLSFHADDFGAKEIAAVGRMGDGGIIQRCVRFLREHDCLLVIHGVEKENDWDLIKNTFLSEPTKGCIISIINPTIKDGSLLARHCVDEKDRVINIKDLEADTVLHHLIKGYRHYGIGGKGASRRGRVFSNRMEEAHDWRHKFGLVVRYDQMSDLGDLLRDPGVISLWGAAGAGKLPLVRGTYYSQMLVGHDDDIISEIYCNYSGDMGFTKFSWVDVPDTFNLTDFSWRLLLDFHSDDLKAKEIAAVGMIEGRQDSIQECRKYLCQDKCFVVINGLRSTDDWNLISDVFLSEPAKGNHIVVITSEASVATYCADNKDRVLNIKGAEAAPALRPLIEDCGYYGNERKEASRFFSNRREDATYWANTFELVGHQNEAGAALADHFLVHSEVGVSSVWGIAGVGKSAIVRNMYYKIMLGLCPRYKYGDTIKGFYLKKLTKFSWVDVPHPFNLVDFCWCLLLDFHSDDLEAKETTALGMMEGQDPIQECRKFLHQECFVVIDGLRYAHDWDLIRDALLPETTKGHIIVIANEANIATHCVEHEHRVVNVRGLEPDAALGLFRMVALGGKQVNPKVTEVLELIMAKCGGLPKVIVAIGEWSRAIRGLEHEQCRMIPDLEYLNNNFMCMLEKSLEFRSLKGLFGWMWSYFDACSDELKPCIFYLPVFPTDHKGIRRRRLLRRWIAEGYSRDNTEEDGEMLFSELVKLSIIQRSTIESPVLTRQLPSKVGICQVNGFFYEYIMSRPMEDNLVFALDGHCSPNLKHTGQHLTIRSNWDRDEIVFNSMDLSRLRSLTVFGEWVSFFISKNMNMGLVRVLDLEDTTSGVTDDVLEQIGKLLPRLKFLSVRGCKGITRVPDSLGGLRQLQTLDVRHTKVAMLPRAIIKLVKLQYVRAGTSHKSSDEDNSAGLRTAPEGDIRSRTMKDGGALESTKDSDDIVPGIAAAVAGCDGTSTSQPAEGAAEGDCTSTSLPTAAAAAGVAAEGDATNTGEPAAAVGGDSRSTSRQTTAEGDGKSEPATRVESDCTRTSQPPPGAAVEVVGTSTSPTSATNIDDTSTAQLAVATAGGHDNLSTSLPAAATDGDGARSHLAEDEPRASTTLAPGSNMACGFLSCSWLSKKLRGPRSDNVICGGVKVPAAGIGNMTALHTLGVVKVHGKGGEAILEEVKKLTQLRKLGVSGINRKNWQGLVSAISGHAHLESLSVHLGKEEPAAANFVDGMFSKLPKTLKSIKLYAADGRAQVSSVLFKQLDNLRKVHIELTISTQEDIDSLIKLPHQGMFREICIKPIQDGKLRYGYGEGEWNSWYGEGFEAATFLRIDCGSYKLVLDFGIWTTRCVEVMVFQCSTTEASLEVFGLDELCTLKKVWLKGSYSEAVKQHLQQKLDKHSNRPVLKLDPQQTQQSAPPAPCACLPRLLT